MNPRPDASAPLVSVVIAAYRCDHYLAEALASALSQTFADVEVIVSDDAASPDTEALVARFGDPRVCYRSNPSPLGSSGNHLAAFREARGDYVAILNHDDVWEKGFLAALVPPLERDPGLVLGFCDHHVIGPAGELLEAETERNTQAWCRNQLAAGVHRPFHGLLAMQSIPLAMGAVFRRSALDLGGFDPASGPAYDLWLTYQLCATGGGAYYTPERLVRWRTHPASQTTQGSLRWSLGSAACWSRVLADPTMRPIHSHARGRLGAALTSAASASLRQGRRGAAFHYGLRALRHRLAWRPLACCLLAAVPRSVSRWAVR